MIQALTVVLGAFLVVVGLSHFLLTEYFERLVPPWLPAVRTWVLASGIAEILIGAGLLATPTRTAAAWAAATLMAVYVLTHLDALARARPHRPRKLDRPAGAAARVVVNVAYLAWAAAVALNV